MLSLIFLEICCDLKLCDSGQFRANLIKFLERMSHLTISYNKKITSEGLFLKGAGNLMTYNASTIRSGRKRLIELLSNFSDYIHNLTDLVFCLENKSLIINYDFDPVIKVKRKRVKLNFKEPF